MPKSRGSGLREARHDTRESTTRRALPRDGGMEPGQSRLPGKSIPYGDALSEDYVFCGEVDLHSLTGNGKNYF